MKNTNILKHHLPLSLSFSQALLHSYVPDSSRFLLLVQGRWIGNRGCGQSETTSVYVYSPSPHTCSVLQWGLSKSSSPSEQTCSRLESSMSTVSTSGPLCCLAQTAGESAQHLKHNLPFLLL